MIKTIIRQIWNERKQNAWLFLELIFASIFLWLAIDPLFTLVCRGNLPKGYTPEKVYIVKHNRYNDEKEFLTQLADAFDNIPEIECSFIAQCELQPNPGGYSSSNVAVPGDTPDSLIDWKAARYYNIITNDKSRFFETIRAIDVKTGKVMQQADYAGSDGAYLSRRQAMSLYGTTDVVGKKFINVFRQSFTILGVFEDLQLVNYDEYTPIVLYCNNVDNYTFGEQIYFRLKDSANEDAFKKKFEEEIMPKYKHGNNGITKLISYTDCIEQHDKQYNITNKYRLYAGLSGFALFCAFMGVFSAFWIRTNNRRRDIGIMRSVGASRHAIIGQFVAEALILVNVAFCVGLFFVENYIHINGFAEPLAKVIVKMPDETPDQSYLHNRAVPHFAIVTAIAYICICAIAIAGALIPATRLTRSLPADALRE